jgi:SAM-dependent methyltransferase
MHLKRPLASLARHLGLGRRSPVIHERDTENQDQNTGSDAMRCNLLGCQAMPLSQFGKKTGRWYGGEFVKLYTCPSCFYIGFPLPDEAELLEYYSNHYGGNSAGWYNLEADYSEKKVSSRAADVTNLLKKYIICLDPVTLEVGCAFGGTVGELRRRSITAFGADLNRDAIEQGRRHGNDYIYANFAHDVMQKHGVKAHLVYAYHALEHIPDAVQFLQSIKESLAGEAILEFRVPNGAYLKAWKLGFESWDWFAFPDHLHMFTPKAVLKLAQRAGFEVVDISSSACGESAEKIREWLEIAPKSLPSELLIRMLEDQMLLQELRFVLCISGSEVADRFRGEINNTMRRCNDSLGMKQLLSFDALAVGSR